MRVEGGSGWLSESQMDYQLIRIKKSGSRGGGGGGGGGRRRRGVRDRKYGGGGGGRKVQRRRRGEERRERARFSRGPVPCCAPRCLYQSRTGNGIFIIVIIILEASAFHTQMKRIACVSSPCRSSLEQLPDDAQTGASPPHTHTQTHTRLCCCCCIGVTHRLSHQPGFGCLFAVWYHAAKLLIGLKK